MTCKRSLTPDLCKNRSCHTPECKLKLGSKLVGHKWLLKVWSFPQKLPVEGFAEGMEIRPAHVSSWGARGKRKGCVREVLQALVFCVRMEENKRMSTTELLFFRARISMADLLKSKHSSLRLTLKITIKTQMNTITLHINKGHTGESTKPLHHVLVENHSGSLVVLFIHVIN